MILNELIFLVVLASLGATPATLLPERFDFGARLALAPVFGFAIGVDVFTTTLWNFAGNQTYWLLPTLCSLSLLGSLAIHGFRSGGFQGFRIPSQRSMLDSVQCLVVCAITSIPVNWTLIRANSHGPVAYQVPDAIVYVNNTDGAQVESIRSAAVSTNKSPDLLLSFWRSYVQAYQRLDAVPLFANTNVLLGEHGTQTESAFLLVLLMVGALGVFAAIRYFTGRGTWFAPIVAVLFGGPFFLQLFFDASQAAICAIVLMVPLIGLGTEIIRRPRPILCVLLALLLSTLASVYPLYVPAVALAAVIVIVGAAIRRFFFDEAAGKLRALIVGGASVISIGVLSIVFNFVGFARTKYALHTVSSSISGQPNYVSLVPRVLLSWLFQSHGFYDLPLSSHSLLDNVLLALLIPVMAIVIIVIAIRRFPLLCVALPIVGGFVAVTIYSRLQTYTGFPSGCTYCEDRNLLPIAPVLILLLGVGLTAIAASKQRWISLGSIGMTGALLAAVGYATYFEQALFASGSYFLPNAITEVLSKLPHEAGGIEQEAFEESPPNPTAELSFVYLAMDEMYPQRASQLIDIDENNASLYYGSGTLSLSDPRFHPNYKFVFTRAANVKTGRKLIFRDGSIGLYERTSSLDVLMDWGFTLNYPITDSHSLPTPTLYSSEPMRFVVTGGTKSSPHAYVRLTFYREPGLTSVTGVDGSTATVRVRKNHVFVCLTTALTAPVRTADVQVEPHYAVQLQAMAVSTQPCGKPQKS